MGWFRKSYNKSLKFKNVNIFSILLISTFLSTQAFAKTNSAKELCDAEVEKDKPNMQIVKKECLITAKEYEAKKEFGTASWYYLLSDKSSYSIKNIESKVKKYFGFSNIAHSYILQNNLAKAKENYTKFLKNSEIPWANSSIKDDYKLLFKLYPNKKELLNKGLAMWKEIYKPLEDIDRLYSKYKKAREDKNYKEAIGHIKKIIKIQKKSKLQHQILIANNTLLLANLYNLDKQYLKSLKNLKSIENLYKNKKYYKVILNEIINCYVNLKKYDSAIKYSKKRIDIFSSYQTWKMMKFYSELSNLYSKINNEAKSRKWSKEEEKLYDFLSRKHEDKDCLNNIYDEKCYFVGLNIYKYGEKKADKYKELNQYKKALIWYRKLRNYNFFEKLKKYKRVYIKRNIEELEIISFENNNTYSQMKYANMYFKNKKYKLALKLYKILYNKGNLDAGYNIGLIYFKGSQEINKDYKLAKKWFEKLAKQNHTKSYKYLALLYEKGYGVHKNNKKAQQWIRKMYIKEAKFNLYKDYLVSSIHDRNFTAIKDTFNKIDFNDLHFAICAATQDGSLDIVKLILKKSPTINLNKLCPTEINNKRVSLLYMASDLGYENLVDYYLNKHIDSSNYSKKMYHTPLERSLLRGHTNIALKLLSENNKSRNTPIKNIIKAAASSDNNFKILKYYSKYSRFVSKDIIDRAFSYSSFKNFKYLIEKYKYKYNPYVNWGLGPVDELKYMNIVLKYNHKISTKYNMLTMAANTRNYNLLKFYIDKNISIDTYREHINLNGKVYLLNASMPYKMIKFILEKSITAKEQINSMFRSSMLPTPVIDMRKIRLLIEYGLNVNIENECGITPLINAKNKDVAKILLEHGANVNHESKLLGIQCGYPKTPLSQAVSNHYINRTKEHIDLLLEAGADINHSIKYNDETLLHILLHDNDTFNLNIFTYLLDKGINLNKTDGNNNSPLAVAIKKNFKSAAIVLLKYNVKITLNDFEMAILYNQIDIFKEMIKKDSFIDFSKLLNLATAEGAVNISEILINKGVRIDINSNSGQQIIFNIYRNKMNFLLKNISIKDWSKIRDQYGNTLLHQAVKEHDMEQIEFFLGKGLGLLKNKRGKLPLNLAPENKMIINIFKTHNIILGGFKNVN